MEKGSDRVVLSGITSNLMNRSNQEEKSCDWKEKLAITVCKEAGIPLETQNSIQLYLEKHLFDSNSSKSTPEEFLCAPNYKIRIIKAAISKLLPRYLGEEVKEKLNILVGPLGSYYPANRDTSDLITTIVDDILKNPTNFE